jgi:hypothetical protein
VDKPSETNHHHAPILTRRGSPELNFLAKPWYARGKPHEGRADRRRVRVCAWFSTA